MKQSLWKCLVLVLILSIFCGCAVGQKYNYHNVMADVNAAGNKTVGVGTYDQRPYVLSGGKSSDVVGLLRGGYGNPFNVTTESGKPLADDMTDAIVASLQRKGFKAVPVIVLPTDSMDAVMKKLEATHGENLILLTLYEWKSDAYMKAGLHYNATLKVFDKNGRTIAESNVKGSDNLGGSVNIVSFSKEAVPNAFKKKLEDLFNNPDIVKALHQ